MSEPIIEPIEESAEMRNARSYAQIVLLSISKLGAEAPTGHASDLSRRREQSDWHLCHLLRELIPVLPEEVKALVQQSVDIREDLWSSAFRDAFYAVKEAV